MLLLEYLFHFVPLRINEADKEMGKGDSGLKETQPLKVQLTEIRTETCNARIILRFFHGLFAAYGTKKDKYKRIIFLSLCCFPILLVDVRKRQIQFCKI